jgi:hypothetical protein
MKHPHNRKGAKRVLDHDKIKAMIEDGIPNKEIAEAVGSKRNYIGKLKGKWGMVTHEMKEYESWL